MELEGTVIQDLPLQEGVSKAGNPWKKKEWILETLGQYPRKVKVQFFGDRADTNRLEIGKTYIIGIDIESREFNGRWYTDVSGFSSRLAGNSAPQAAAPAMGEPAWAAGAPASPASFDTAAGSGDDLPF